ncbi:MAG: biotin--[acetyl-CoA-carboxylase] ligase [Candidatus Omnitrophica bacterium]|nr:biotin--[acetyl-CoA-carboxylase] ligase [Candidatus Omnitrophota bacterium]MBU4477686.1 biotin--[acetyl-CoA-carboxylase] ligase [Candidatus Omnitrophota bacterium]MCG2703883.1 biotin--[acetyl-CoA-carboxylase] ligase [Candidatus Omnitrophota bacterium]
METEILRFLKENCDTFVSGEEISHRLHVSRTAVWKHIQNLKENGYEILAQPHLGYRLLKSPDRMLPDEIGYGLKTDLIGKKIISYASTTSTNDIGCSLAEQCAAEGTVIISEEQTRGKGRQGRSWVSPKGAGIYFSVILRPGLSPAEAGKITLMASVAVSRAIRNSLGLNACIKWPNDVYIGSEKVCGILTEMNAEQDAVNFIVLGIGINVNTSRQALPQGATSLKLQLHKSVDRIQLLQELLREIERQYELITRKNFPQLMDAWRNYSLTLGHRIKIKWRNAEIEGQAMDIDENGALMVRDDFGFMHHILSGDVRVVR